MYDNNELPRADITRLAVQLAPDAPTLRNKDGSINWMLNSSGRRSWHNPLVDFDRNISK